MQAMFNRRAALTLALAAAVILPTAASAAPVKRTLDYVILKDGEPIGAEKVDITRDGDSTTVEVTASTKVKMLMLSFTYDHKRRETWRAGRLESVSAETNDDGTPHKLEMTRAGASAGWRLTVDGQSADLPADAFPLALWTAAVVKSPLLVGVIDGQRYKVAAKPVGDETVDVAGKPVKTKRWRIDGDIERDVWFADDGMAAQIAFKRRGYDIVYRLK